MKATQERWLPVVGYEGLYEVSNRGRVHSIPRIKLDGSRNPGRILRPRGDRPRVCLYRDGDCRWLRVSRLVVEAFLGPGPEGMEVCHNNGEPSDNRLENLRWDTHVNNMLDKRIHGTATKSGRNECPYGHEYDEANTLAYGNKRKCLTCTRAYHRRYYLAVTKPRRQERRRI